MRFFKQNQLEKKERKSEIEQNICVLQVKMQFLCRKHINLQASCVANKLQQQPSGPARPWFCVCVVQFDNKINDSYTKRESVSVQGVQQ